MKIADLVTLDDKAEFRSAVQLSAYDDPTQNLALLRSYLFSTAIAARSLSQARDISAVGLLRLMTDAHVHRAPNCLCLIANYGHGKSHLALALANYFAKPAGSPEVKEILDKLTKAIGDRAAAAHYTDFKNNNAEFLLIRLRGDVAKDLRAQFLLALEQGLREHHTTRDAKLPFWYAEAARLLESLSPDEATRADAWLAERGRDLPLLRREIAQRQDVFDETVGALRAAKNMTPGLNEVGLAEALRWASDTFVATGQLGGILVLFDEFSLYVERYGHRNAPAELQDLLNGIDTLRGRALFLAFAQADPDTTADNLDSLNTAGLASLKKALNRLEIKRNLSTLLESVIDAYLFQDKTAWSALKKSPYVNGALSAASDIAYERFAPRYHDTLRWSTTTFQENVTLGCFPLHPITTYLLCNMPLGTTSDAGSTRTMLGFVRTYLEEKQTQPVVEDNRPNWVLPVHLLDYFKDRFSGPDITAYENAVRTAGPEATDAQQALLKALLLQQLADVKARRGDDQLAFLAQSAGLDETTAKAELRALMKASAIQFHDERRTYSFFSATVNSDLLKRKLLEKAEQLPFNANALTKLNNSLVDSLAKGTFGERPIDVDWGYPGDWAAREHLLTAEGFSAEWLRQAVAPVGVGPRSESLDGHRANVFWLVAKNDDQVGQFREESQAVVDQAFPGDYPQPVVIVLPDRPRPGLIDAFQRLRALETLSNSESAEIGAEMIKHARDRAQADILDGLRGVRGANDQPFDIAHAIADYVMPDAYRRHLQAITVSRLSLGHLVRASYEWAYPLRPPVFDTRYPVAAQGGSKFKSSVIKIAEYFFECRSRDLPRLTTSSDAMTRDLFEKYLRGPWKLLKQDYSLQPPPVAGLERAWEYLDTTCPPGGPDKPADRVLMTLHNPPYGFDYATALLLFAAWVGYHGSDVQITQGGRLVKVNTLTQALGKSPKDFFKQIGENKIAIARRDPSSVEKTVRERLKALDQGAITQPQAQNTMAELSGWATDTHLNPRLREEAAEAGKRLQQALTAAEQYDNETAAIVQALASADLVTVLQQRRKAGGLAPVTLVKTQQPPPVELQAVVDRAIDAQISRLVTKWGTLDNIGDYSRNRDRLQSDRRKLQEAGLAAAAEPLDAALAQLEVQAQALQLQQQEQPTRDRIADMRLKLPLAELYKQRDTLASLQGFGESTMSLRDQKLAQMEDEIARLERQARALPGVILACADTQTLRATRESLLRSAGSYEGTVWADSLHDAQQLADRCEQFLTSLSTVERNVDALRGPDDVLSLQASLSQLEAESGSWAGDQQRALLQQARARIEMRVVAKQAEAADWFRQIAANARQQTASVQLLDKLKAPPAFLSREQAVTVHDLRRDLEQAIDRDVVARIEQQFRQIRDPQIRQTCLERLQQITHEADIRADGDGRR